MREIKPDSGVLFENENPNSSKSPAYRGNFYKDTTKYSLSAWDIATTSNLLSAGRGLLFQNKNKSQDLHPDLIGSITTPDGVRHALSGWNRESKEGNRYISLSVRPWSGQFSEIPSEFLSLACKDWVDGAGR